ncbi:MAG TPA: helix-turn-helix domain-containing protein [Verrucomicrobiae bacterium]|mgnify:CR=1 FL=1|nr:helix-turn-helix domain-containing protein [Verrucomicrobiae bacterium]
MSHDCKRQAEPPIPLAEFRAIALAYRRRFGFVLACCGPSGDLLFGNRACRATRAKDSCAGCRLAAVNEALRWGEPCVSLCPAGLAIWAVPLMRNARVTGGLVAAGVNLEPESAPPAEILRHVRSAAQGLLEIAEQRNVTNGALLGVNRARGRQERERAEAIHEFKSAPPDRMRRVYLIEEPSLLAAVSRGDRRGARGAVQRILAGFRSAAPDRPDLLNDLALEILVMMARAAIEAGAEPAEALGGHARWRRRLAEPQDERALGAWLSETAERLAAAIPKGVGHFNASLAKAVAFIEKNLSRDVGRDETARAVGMSPSHFSRVVRRELDRTFTALVAGLRIDRARHLLARTDKSLVQIALDCGFCDQSHFSKAFRRHAGVAPLEFRKTHAPSQPDR